MNSLTQRLLARMPIRRLRRCLAAAFASNHKPTAISLPPNVGAGKHVDVTHARITAEGRNWIGEGSQLVGSISLGYGSTVGRFSHLFGGSILIGRYCQLGPCVAIYAINHPYTHLTSYVNRTLFDGRMKQHQRPSTITIGSDVWIGHGAIVLPHVTIGDGAVVGAGAIVTRDVEAFSVVAGNPARCIRRRFNEETTALVRSLRWWDMTPDQLTSLEPLFHIEFASDNTAAVDELREYVSKQ